MFIAKNKGAIVFAANTIEEIENLGIGQGFVFDEIEETQDEYIFENGQYVKVDAEYIAKQLEDAKAQKLADNAKAREVEYISTSKGRLKTLTPLGDLKAAIPLYEKLVQTQNGLLANSVRFYDGDGNAFGNEAMTFEEFSSVVLEIAVGYIGIDAKSTAYTQSIIGAESLEALEAIVLDYSGV